MIALSLFSIEVEDLNNTNQYLLKDNALYISNDHS